MGRRLAVLAARRLLFALVIFAALAAFAQAARAQPSPAPSASPSAPPSSQASTPRPLNYTPPRYPPEAEKAGLEANVVLKLDIDKTGKVTKAEVVEPAGHGFDEAAVEAAMQLAFEPARRPDGTAVAARILYRYAFTL